MNAVEHRCENCDAAMVVRPASRACGAWAAPQVTGQLTHDTQGGSHGDHGAPSRATVLTGNASARGQRMSSWVGVRHRWTWRVIFPRVNQRCDGVRGSTALDPGLASPGLVLCVQVCYRRTRAAQAQALRER